MTETHTHTYSHAHGPADTRITYTLLLLGFKHTHSHSQQMAYTGNEANPSQTHTHRHGRHRHLHSSPTTIVTSMPSGHCSCCDEFIKAHTYANTHLYTPTYACEFKYKRKKWKIDFVHWSSNYTKYTKHLKANCGTTYIFLEQLFCCQNICIALLILMPVYCYDALCSSIIYSQTKKQKKLNIKGSEAKNRIWACLPLIETCDLPTRNASNNLKQIFK